MHFLLFPYAFTFLSGMFEGSRARIRDPLLNILGAYELTKMCV